MIDVEVTSNIAVIRMNRGKVNAMDADFCRSLTRELNRIAASEVGAAILVGNDRVFSAGVDLVTLRDGGRDYLRQFLPALVECFKTLFRFPKPVVAAINGHAVAGGCILATACDHRLIHAKARIGIPELRVGVPLPSIAIETLRFAVAPGAIQTMVNIGKMYRGDEALRIGLADRMVDQSQIMSCALDAAEELLTIPRAVFEISKQQMRAPANRTVEQNEADYEERAFEIWHSDEIRDVVGEYVLKRL